MTFRAPLEGRRFSYPEMFGVSMPVFNADRVAFLKQRVSQGTLTGRLLQKWNGILAVNNTYQPVGPLNPFFIPSYYDDPTGNEEAVAIIRSDAERAVDLGVRWRVLENPADAQAVKRILEPWTTLQSFSIAGDSRLNWSNKWPMFIQAAQLISNSPVYTPAFHQAMAAVTRRGLGISSAFIQNENRAMWGVVANLASAAFLNDRALFDNALYRWRMLFSHDVEGNIPVGEIRREGNGLFYCNFLLNAMTQAAEIARFNGEWLYDFIGPDGSTYRGLWETVARWTAHPEEYPYWPGSSTLRIQAHVDPLHALWPNADSQYLIDTYTTTQDFFGYRQGMLAYRDLPLYG